VKVVKHDAGTFDFAAIAPIDVMLLDVDLYRADDQCARETRSRFSE